MTRCLCILMCVALAGCGRLSGGEAPAVVPGSQVQPGLASCLASIGRADVARDPEAPLSNDETSGLLTCVAQRAAS